MAINDRMCASFGALNWSLHIYIYRLFQHWHQEKRQYTPRLKKNLQIKKQQFTPREELYINNQLFFFIIESPKMKHSSRGTFFLHKQEKNSIHKW